MGETKKLEVCINNIDLGSGFVWDQTAQNYPEIRLRRWSCLGYCHRCIHAPYVLLNDTEYIEGTSAEDLWQKVQAFIEEHRET